MSQTTAALLLASTFTTYTPSGALPRIEAVTDRGPVLELIVRCRVGTAIISYSKMERLYCGPRGGCVHNREAIIARVCS